jgi:plastocyanin/sugar lactone lactonase YvrE
MFVPGELTLAQTTTTVEVYASGFINPKGMAFGLDGTLYVAESGPPGEVMVPLPANFGGQGPIGTGGSISRVPVGGEREAFVTGLPNIGLYSGAEMLGVASVAVLDGQLYQVAAGHMTVSPFLSRVMPDGTLEPVSDIGKFNDDNPPPPSNGDAVPMGNPYDLIAMGGKLYITDGNYNRVIEATTDGDLKLLAQWEDSPVTVGAAAGPDGNLYVAQFAPAPYTPGTGAIDMVSPDGTVTPAVVGNLTTPVDVAFAPDGTMYVLQFAAEYSAAELRYIPFGGEVQRVNEDGTVTPVVTNLVYPTAMTFGPDGALYVANYGNAGNNGEGQVLRVVPGEGAVAAPDVPAPSEESNAPPTPEALATAPADVEIALTIEIVEGATPNEWGYTPENPVIQVGQAVEFVNRGQMWHTATADDGSFDTGAMYEGDRVVIVFDEPGEFGFFCQPHPWMRGMITVEGERSDSGDGVVAGFANLDPPSVKVWQVGIFAGILLVGVIGAGVLSRRKHEPATPEPQPGDDLP